MPTSPNILVAQPVHERRLAVVRGLATVDVRDPIVPGQRLPDDDLRDRTVLFTDHCPANVEVMTSLRWIQLGSAGYQQLAGLELPEGIRVTNASGVNDIPIAEWCLLMMLSSVRDFPQILRRQAEHVYDRAARFQAELRGRRVGIFGYGSIGREVGRLARAVGLEVWALSRSGFGARPLRYGAGWTEAGAIRPDREFGAHELGEAFLRGLDFLVVTAPLTDATRGVIGARELASLPRHAVVINPARAHVIDESALLAALRDEAIGGAALDSHYREPMPPGDPFWDAPRTTITPHVSGSTGSTHFVDRLWELFELNVGRYLAGEPLFNEISAADLAALPR